MPCSSGVPLWHWVWWKKGYGSGLQSWPALESRFQSGLQSVQIYLYTLESTLESRIGLASSGAQTHIPSSIKPNAKVELRRSKASAKSFSIHAPCVEGCLVSVLTFALASATPPTPPQNLSEEDTALEHRLHLVVAENKHVRLPFSFQVIS